MRSGDWKFLRAAPDRKMLFDLVHDRGERTNVCAEHADLAAQLEAKLAAWAGEMSPPGLPEGPLSTGEQGVYGFYFGDAAIR